MKKFLLLFFSFFVLLVFHSFSVLADDYVHQFNQDDNTHLFRGDYDRCQTYDVDKNITNISVQYKSFGSSGDITGWKCWMSICTDYGNSSRNEYNCINSSMIHDCTDIDSTGQQYGFYWNDSLVSWAHNESQYWFCGETDGSGSDGVLGYIRWNAPDPYENGSAYQRLKTGGSWSALGQDFYFELDAVEYNITPSLDYTMSFNDPTPLNYTVDYINFSINASCENGNVSLWFGLNTTNLTNEVNQEDSPYLWNSSLTVSERYYYKGSCDNGETNSSDFQYIFLGGSGDFIFINETADPIYYCDPYTNATDLDCVCPDGYFQQENGICAKRAGGSPYSSASYTEEYNENQALQGSDLYFYELWSVAKRFPFYTLITILVFGGLSGLALKRDMFKYSKRRGRK